MLHVHYSTKENIVIATATNLGQFKLNYRHFRTYYYYKPFTCTSTVGIIYLLYFLHCELFLFLFELLYYINWYIIVMIENRFFVIIKCIAYKCYKYRISVLKTKKIFTKHVICLLLIFFFVVNLSVSCMCNVIFKNNFSLHQYCTTYYYTIYIYYTIYLIVIYY